ncbi:DUF1592 domain-containing protein, partial [Akkermansiaceae bacterium]|nr:DUF1592 domain-containing protein [Akkermansiaceae bacterium]
LGPALCAAGEPSFEKDLQPYLDQHCVRCHGEKKQKGDFRLDELSRKVGEHDTPHWAEVMERISSGEMPPEDEENLPAADESARIVAWISERLHEGESARMAQRSRVSYHRLTREEYVNAVRDLIGVEYDATDPGGLLEDPEWHGFERIGSVLTLSPSHIEKYLKAAEVILDEAYPDKSIPYLELTKRAEELQEHHDHYERLKAEGLLNKIRVPLTTSGEIFRRSSPYRGPDKSFPGPGIYEISYTICGITPKGGRPPRMQVYEHKLDRVLFEQDILAPEDKPVTVTFQVHFPDVHGPEIHVLNQNGLRRHPRTNASSRIPFITTAYPRAPWQMKITDQEGKPRFPILIIDSISMRGPIITAEEQRRRDAYMASEETIKSAREGLARMARRAFRRPLHSGELDSYLGIVKGELEAGESFKNAVKAGMIAILCSKSFLFIAEGDENANRHHLNDWELATRLSFLLWNTMPDDELFELAENGRLGDKEILRQQFHRLLADPRAERFIRSFSTQWLHLRKVGKFPPDKKIYPNYDQHLEQSMVGETQAFFGEVLHQGLSLREFIDSDWTMLNPRLARFYDIPVSDESRDEFQRVALHPENHRGGLLTHASVLSLTSDGTRHRPVHRGAWVSEAILGKTPPPPPANVDPIEPNPLDQPKATLRMKLAAHIHDPNCAACHKAIDPYGLAFDNYDAIGAWRTHENVEGTGDDPLVDASGQFPDGRAFQNSKEFRQLLMADMDDFNATFIEKLAIYGTRRTMTFDDRNDLKLIEAIGRENDYRVRDILEAFVLSDLFRKR